MRNILTFRRCTGEEIRWLVGTFESQFPTSSNWQIKEVDINEVIPLCKYVYSSRLEFAKESIRKCIRYDVPLFYPYVVEYDNGDTHLVAPPVIEERNNSLYLGDGMHRIYEVLKLDSPVVTVVITHNCYLPLPGMPQDWDNVKENGTQLPCDMNFERFYRQGLTGYSKFSNSKMFWRYVGK